MNKILDFFKQIYNVVKNWVVANGVEGILGLIAGLVLRVLGYKVWAGFAFGVFATRNFDILKAWVNGLLKK